MLSATRKEADTNDLDECVEVLLKTSAFSSEIFFFKVYQEVGRSGLLLSGIGEDVSSRWTLESWRERSRRTTNLTFKWN